MIKIEKVESCHCQELGQNGKKIRLRQKDFFHNQRKSDFFFYNQALLFPEQKLGKTETGKNDSAVVVGKKKKKKKKSICDDLAERRGST